MTLTKIHNQIDHSKRGEMEIGGKAEPADADEPHLSPSKSKSKKPGGWRAIAYILGNESFEKLGSMSLIANITVYLRTKYNLSGVLLVNVVTIWSGTANLSSILGAIVSDVYLGRFLTLLFGTVFSLLGMLGMTLTAGLPDLRPPPCESETNCGGPHHWQLSFLFASLGLIAMGAGGIRPCNIAFGADQFDTNTAQGRAQLESFFNWWYFSFTIALVVALTGVVYVQNNVSWLAGFAIPTACLAASIAIFLVGRHAYVYKIPRGSVFVDMAKVSVAAFKKRNANASSLRFYDPPGDEEWQSRKKTSSLGGFGFLDRAALISDSNEMNSEGFPVSSWRLCSLQQVDCLKCVLGVFPVWVSGIGCFLVMDQQSTFGVLQAIQMDRKVGRGRSFTIPPGWMGISSMIALSIWILIYERIFLLIAKKATRKDFRLETRVRIGVGILMSIVCMVVAGCVERKRRQLAVRSGSFVSPLHVLVLLPQFALSGLTEAFGAVALMEFFTRQLPESMRSIAGAIFFLSLSAASYLSSLIVNVMHSVTGGGERAWIGGDNLNGNKLDRYYFIVAAIGVVNFVYFTCYAIKYVPLEKSGDELESGKSTEICRASDR